MNKKKDAVVSNMVAQRIADARPSILKQLRMQAHLLHSDDGRSVIDLASGNPEFSPPPALHSSLLQVAAQGHFSYGDPKGTPELRAAVASYLLDTQRLAYDADSEVLVTAGATAGLTAALLALVDPGNSVAMFAPFFENFPAQVKLAGGIPKYVPLSGPKYTFDEGKLERALTGKKNFLILNCPHNPTGRVFTREELQAIAHVCKRKNTIVFSDEAYAPFFYKHPHVSIAAIDGMQDRSIIIHSWSKSFNAPGWRVGSVTAPAALMGAIGRLSDLALGGTSTHVQLAFAAAIAGQSSYMADIRQRMDLSRTALEAALCKFGFKVAASEGTLSLWADGAALAIGGDKAICKYLLEKAGILAAPGSAFFQEKTPSGKDHATSCLRFSFARNPDTINSACLRLAS